MPTHFERERERLLLLLIIIIQKWVFLLNYLDSSMKIQNTCTPLIFFLCISLVAFSAIVYGHWLVNCIISDRSIKNKK